MPSATKCYWTKQVFHCQYFYFEWAKEFQTLLYSIAHAYAWPMCMAFAYIYIYIDYSRCCLSSSVLALSFQSFFYNSSFFSYAVYVFFFLSFCYFFVFNHSFWYIVRVSLSTFFPLHRAHTYICVHMLANIQNLLMIRTIRLTLQFYVSLLIFVEFLRVFVLLLLFLLLLLLLLLRFDRERCWIKNKP